MHPDQSRSLEEQLHELRARVLRLEDALHGQVPLQKAVAPPPPPAASPQVSEASAAVSAFPVMQQTANRYVGPSMEGPPIIHVSLPASSAKDRSLESRIGSQWFNRIGILAVLIAMSWFLKLAIDNHWIGPLGRVLIGLVAGAGIILWSEHFQRRGYGAFAYSLKAVGSGILYLSLWAAFSLFHLIPASVAFAAMIAVTAFNGFMAWTQDAELLALYSIVGGLSTPLLLSTGENHEVSLFSYLLLLNIAVLVLAILRPWSRLLSGSFCGTAALFAGWWFAYYTDAQFARTAFFLGCFFLMFAFAPRLIRIEAEKNRLHWESIVLVPIPIANAALGFLAFYAMFSQANASWAGPWLAVSFAAFYLLLLRLPSFGILHDNSEVSAILSLTTSVVFLTIAIPLKAHGRWLIIGWLMQGAALLWIAKRISSKLLRVLALICLVLGLVALIVVNPPASITPVFNERFAAYCVGIAVFAFAAWLARDAQSVAEDTQEPYAWVTLAPAFAVVVSALILMAVSWEIHSYWWFARWRGDWQLMHDYRMYAHFTYSAFFMFYGALLLGAGFWRRSAFLRWQALLLLAVSIGKVFLVDISALSQGYRILSFLGLGGVLLAVSFVYQRDWLRLRVPDHSAAGPHDEQST